MSDALHPFRVLVQAYEETHLPSIPPSPPQDIVLFALEQRGLTPADLAPWLGGRSRASEFLSGKRRLSIGQMKALKKHLGLSADLLIEAE